MRTTVTCRCKCNVKCDRHGAVAASRHRSSLSDVRQSFPFFHLCKRSETAGADNVAIYSTRTPGSQLNLFTACSPECIIGARPTIDRPVDSAPAQVEARRGIHEREPPSALVRLVDIWLPLCSSHGSTLRCCHNVRWYVNVLLK